MNEPMTASTVEGLNRLLRRSRLLGHEEIERADQRWREESPDPTHLGAYSRWLMQQQYVTEYQMHLLLTGHVDNFFLGPYKLLERIGKGRLASVYKAVHRLGQTVAIKVLPPSRGKLEEIRKPFLLQAERAQKLNHPNVVRTLDMGVEARLCYVVMEYLDGETLQKILQRRGPLPVELAAEIIYQALLGLQHLHEHQLVHRNLEPANLLLMRTLEIDSLLATFQVKILDISWSRMIGVDSETTGLTPQQLGYEGLLLETPTYLAPELARSEQGTDIRADIYSLGCVLYHTMAGQPPFADARPMNMLIRHATEPPRPIRTLAPNVPERLEQILNQMIAKDPTQRFQTPLVAAEELRRFLDAKPTVELPAPVLPALPLPQEEPPKNLFAVVDEPGVESHPPRRATTSGRDVWMLLLGGLGVIVVQILVWLIVRK